MTTLNIDRLTLKLSGISQQEGQHLAQLISTKLSSNTITSDSLGDVPALRLNITAQPNANMNWLADQIVSEVLRQLNQTLA